MPGLRLFLFCVLLSRCLISTAVESANEDRPVASAAHKQQKYAGPAGSYANLENAEQLNSNPSNRNRVRYARDRTALTKEERRALRRQVNESVSRYPHRR